MIDGELVVLGEDGKPSFQALQYFDPQDTGRLFFYAFDLMHLNGVDVMRHRSNRRIKESYLARGSISRHGYK